VTGNPDNLRRAAAAKRTAAYERADAGLRRLLKRGDAVTFTSVAAAAGVSKDFLYRNAELRDRIARLRSQQDGAACTASTTVETTSDVSSVVRTLTLKLSRERAQHREEITDLRAALAAAHGELLALTRRLAKPAD